MRQHIGRQCTCHETMRQEFTSDLGLRGPAKQDKLGQRRQVFVQQFGCPAKDVRRHLGHHLPDERRLQLREDCFILGRGATVRHPPGPRFTQVLLVLSRITVPAPARVKNKTPVGNDSSTSMRKCWLGNQGMNSIY